MDPDRQIRFLIPPFFLYASVLWWVLLNPSLGCYLAGFARNKEIFAVVTAAGATVPLGYLIGTIELFLARLIFSLLSRKNHGPRLFEASLRNESFRDILYETTRPKKKGDNQQKKEPSEEDWSDLLYVTATFDHELIRAGVHKWIERRWNACNVAFNSALAIVISSLVCLVVLRNRPFDASCGLSQSQWAQSGKWNGNKCWWFGANFVAFCLFLYAGCKARRETMEMIEFQSRRGLTASETSAENGA